MENVRDVVVVGEGSALGTPDRCLISLALNVAADTSADAIDRVAQLADQAVGVIHAQGIEPSDVQTYSVSLQDFFDHEKKRVTARVASYALSVNAPSLASVGRLLAELAAISGTRSRFVACTWRSAIRSLSSKRPDVPLSRTPSIERTSWPRPPVSDWGPFCPSRRAATCDHRLALRGPGSPADPQQPNCPWRAGRRLSRCR